MRSLARTSAVIMATALALSLSSTRARADDGEPPAASRTESNASIRMPLFVAGTATFAVSYAVPIIIAAQYDFHDQGGWFFVPVAGPAVYFATRRGCAPSNDAFNESACSFGDTMLLIAVVTDMLLRAGGVATAIVGLALPSEPEPAAKAARARPLVLPVRGGATLGVSLDL